MVKGHLKDVNKMLKNDFDRLTKMIQDIKNLTRILFHGRKNHESF